MTSPSSPRKTGNILTKFVGSVRRKTPKTEPNVSELESSPDDQDAKPSTEVQLLECPKEQVYNGSSQSGSRKLRRAYSYIEIPKKNQESPISFGSIRSMGRKVRYGMSSVGRKEDLGASKADVPHSSPLNVPAPTVDTKIPDSDIGDLVPCSPGSENSERRDHGFQAHMEEDAPLSLNRAMLTAKRSRLPVLNITKDGSPKRFAADPNPTPLPGTTFNTLDGVNDVSIDTCNPGEIEGYRLMSTLLEDKNAAVTGSGGETNKPSVSPVLSQSMQRSTGAPHKLRVPFRRLGAATKPEAIPTPPYSVAAQDPAPAGHEVWADPNVGVFSPAIYSRGPSVSGIPAISGEFNPVAGQIGSDFSEPNTTVASSESPAPSMGPIDEFYQKRAERKKRHDEIIGTSPHESSGTSQDIRSSRDVSRGSESSGEATQIVQIHSRSEECGDGFHRKQLLTQPDDNSSETNTNGEDLGRNSKMINVPKTRSRLPDELYYHGWNLATGQLETQLPKAQESLAACRRRLKHMLLHQHPFYQEDKLGLDQSLDSLERYHSCVEIEQQATLWNALDIIKVFRLSQLRKQQLTQRNQLDQTYGGLLEGDFADMSLRLLMETKEPSEETIARTRSLLKEATYHAIQWTGAEIRSLAMLPQTTLDELLGLAKSPCGDVAPHASSSGPPQQFLKRSPTPWPIFVQKSSTPQIVRPSVFDPSTDSAQAQPLYDSINPENIKMTKDSEGIRSAPYRNNNPHEHPLSREQGPKQDTYPTTSFEEWQEQGFNHLSLAAKELTDPNLYEKASMTLEQYLDLTDYCSPRPRPYKPLWASLKDEEVSEEERGMKRRTLRCTYVARLQGEAMRAKLDPTTPEGYVVPEFYVGGNGRVERAWTVKKGGAWVTVKERPEKVVSDEAADETETEN
ncbi:uncharacterized protein K452DRAFT_356402 [Aplosporella prunicola CBS 121167]|uniref:Uncharacterized protein n=1 Tax=Aplosporella prunicola CBS 121167 TaxID=1176127 RepID=A0A6A6BNR7_9PEZI|nr:uncharacterized protein K452DRAFT_356402 [Aplosporella prunicola CBS 121167]KAF2145073.1 hypothetical protein K452DRAFT_356402 [Aplosporella prunicola CBS 121167]